MHGREFFMRWIIRGWPGPSADGLGPRLALNTARPSTDPRLARNSALPPARALLDHRQASFALRLLARPENSGGQEEILRYRNSDLMARIRRICGLGRGETAEVQIWEEFREMRASVIVEEKEEALRTAKEWTDQENSIWTDGSRLENGAVGAAVAFKEEGVWKGKGFYLGKNKEVFDAETYAIYQAMRTLDDRGDRGRRYTFSNSQAAVSRIQHDRTGPGQALAILAIEAAEAITGRDNSITIRWTPSHARVEGNELADDMARRSAEEREERAPPAYLREASLSHLTRTATEARSAATAEWIRVHSGHRRRYNPQWGGR